MPFDFSAADSGITIYRALRHDLRQTIINYIEENPGTTVTEMFCALRLEQSLCSQHLRILRDAGLVFSERDGKQQRYYLNTENITAALEAAQELQSELQI